MKKLAYILPLFLMFAMASCDVIPSNEIVEPIENDTTVVDQKRIILLEEFTGNRCPNCPKAAVEAEKLMEMYPNQIVLVAIHSGEFARPIPQIGYTEDFRTEVGNEITSHYGIQAYPKGIINRTKVNSAYALDYGEWEDVIAEAAAQNSTVDIQIVPTFDAATRTASVSVNTNTSGINETNVKLCVYLTEDNLVCKQANGSEVIEDFPHDHVLRDSFNGTWGENINIGKDSKTYSMVLDEKWNHENCNIVAFVYNGNTEEVYQAFQVKF